MDIHVLSKSKPFLLNLQVQDCIHTEIQETKNNKLYHLNTRTQAQGRSTNDWSFLSLDPYRIIYFFRMWKKAHKSQLVYMKQEYPTYALFQSS